MSQEVNALIAELKETIVHQSASLRVKDLELIAYRNALGQVKEAMEGAQREAAAKGAKIDELNASLEVMRKLTCDESVEQMLATAKQAIAEPVPEPPMSPPVQAA